ncbi:MAG: amino acid permease, partial [Rhodocyclaceae bacterium]
PGKTIPKAINQVLYRILIFYIGALAVLLSLTPWDTLVASLAQHAQAGDEYGGSPFVMVFSLLGSDVAAHILNFVVLTAALSVYNSCVYCNSRMLYGLADQGNAPRALMKVDRRGVPLLALGVSALVTALCVLINYVVPATALEMLMALVVAALVINWAMISLAHIMFRKAKQREGVTPKFKALWYPLGNYLCLAFVVVILGIMFYIPPLRPSVLAIPVWLVLLAVCYAIKQSRSK